jgi:Chemotaxis response regulator containing a CheY-like receiver domain and a methylesterase domain
MAQESIKPSRVIIIGGSAGSLNGVLSVLPEIAGIVSFAVIIVLHRKPAGENILVNLLAAKTRLTVKEAEEKEPILPGHMYIAPADYHLLVEKDYSFSLDVSEKVHYSRPSIDVTFESAAEAFGPKAIAILLSGANIDGAAGMQKIKECGGVCIVQEPGSAEVGVMPQQAIDTVAVDKILPTEKMAAWINENLLI